MTEAEQIRQRLENLTGLCGDHSCIFGPPKGLGTNGGCRCEARNPRVQEAVQLLRRLVRLEENPPTPNHKRWCSKYKGLACSCGAQRGLPL